jgi:hypothetical protein
MLYFCTAFPELGLCCRRTQTSNFCEKCWEAVLILVACAAATSCCQRRLFAPPFERKTTYVYDLHYRVCKEDFTT